MAEAPTMEKEMLGPDDAVDVLEELLPAQNKSYELGLKLKLPQHVVEAIHSKDLPPDKYLLKVLIKFLQQAEPRATWRVIVEALRSPAVDLPALAQKVEAAHCTPTLSVVSESTEEYSAVSATTGEEEIKSKASTQLCSESEVTNLQGAIESFHRRFSSIKDSTIKCLEKCCITILRVVYLLTNVMNIGEHKKYLEDKQQVLRKSEDHLELFGSLNFYWNYLSFDLFDGLINELSQENSEFNEIKEEMEKYKREMEKFRESTTLVLFCEVQQHTETDPPPGFQKLVTEHQWPETVTLKDVEDFRKRFLHTLGLPECAMMVYRIRRKCFEVTWFGVIPESVGQLLRGSDGTMEVLKDFKVISVEIDGECVYQSPTDPIQSILPDATGEREDSSPTTHLQEQTHGTSVTSPVSPSSPGFSERLEKVAKLKQIPKTLSRNMLFVQCGHENIPWQVDRGSAATDGEFIYFSSYNITTIYQFELSSREWKKLRSSPYQNSGLVVIDKKLTTAGGRCNYFFTKKLLTLQQKKWVEEYPPMITARSSPAVVSSSDGEYIIVIGGLARGLARGHRDCWTATVELLKVETKVWYKLSDLPQPLDYPSATICDNQLYVIGGDHPNGYSYSLQALQSSALETTQNLILWVPLPPLPVTGSTAATLCGQLVIVGGVQDRSLVDSIHQLEDGQWVEIGHMGISRSWCLAASLLPNRIITVGGQGALNLVEECELFYHYVVPALL